ncbi:MAG: hypothetical protein OEZ02_02325 [Anaerolineae bacterium]|nr:hypothetical protein [Anaerolineae bacterium]
MADCCIPLDSDQAGFTPVGRQSSDTATPTLHCPHCQTKGKSVDTQTVKAQLAVSLETLRSNQYRFCAAARCPVVYYAEDVPQIYTEKDLRQRVFQKAGRDLNVTICYCFSMTLADLKSNNLQPPAITAIERVNAGIQAGQCACDIRNPQGSCCLGNLRAALTHIRQE